MKFFLKKMLVYFTGMLTFLVMCGIDGLEAQGYLFHAIILIAILISLCKLFVSAKEFDRMF